MVSYKHRMNAGLTLSVLPLTQTHTTGQCPSYTEHFFRPRFSVASLFHLFGLSRATEFPLTKQFAVQLALQTQINTALNLCLSLNK